MLDAVFGEQPFDFRDLACRKAKDRFVQESGPNLERTLRADIDHGSPLADGTGNG
jgi:hypothetical protein